MDVTKQAEYESTIYRLNSKIKDLVRKCSYEESKNADLLTSQNKLFSELQDLKIVYSGTEKINHRYIEELQKEREEKKLLQETLKWHKEKHFNLQEKCLKQNEWIKTLEASIQTLSSISVKREYPVTIIGSISDINRNEKVSKLEQRIKQIEDELNEAYDVIDELEFELESIDYLETENVRLQQQLNEMANQILEPESFAMFSLSDTNNVPTSNPNIEPLSKESTKNDDPKIMLCANNEAPLTSFQEARDVVDSQLRRQMLSKKLGKIKERKSDQIKRTSSNQINNH